MRGQSQADSQPAARSPQPAASSRRHEPSPWRSATTKGAQKDKQAQLAGSSATSSLPRRRVAQCSVCPRRKRVLFARGEAGWQPGPLAACRRRSHKKNDVAKAGAPGWRRRGPKQGLRRRGSETARDSARQGGGRLGYCPARPSASNRFRGFGLEGCPHAFPGRALVIFLASSKSSHDVSTLLQLSLAPLARQPQSPLARPMSWFRPSRSQSQSCAPSPGPRSGVALLAPDD
jgi:hypothetical protein